MSGVTIYQVLHFECISSLFFHRATAVDWRKEFPNAKLSIKKDIHYLDDRLVFLPKQRRRDTPNTIRLTVFDLRLVKRDGDWYLCGVAWHQDKKLEVVALDINDIKFHVRKPEAMPDYVRPQEVTA